MKALPQSHRSHRDKEREGRRDGETERKCAPISPPLCLSVSLSLCLSVPLCLCGCGASVATLTERWSECESSESSTGSTSAARQNTSLGCRPGWIRCGSRRG